MRLGVFCIAALLASAAGAVGPQRHPYREHWKKDTFGKRALAVVGARSALAQATGKPKEFGGGVAGFGKRLGFGFATHAVKTTVEHAVAAPLHEDLTYHKSTDRRFSRRLRHALISTVVTSNTRTGKRTPAAGRISGNAAAGAVSGVVLHAAAGASTAGVGLAGDAGANVAREFWPHHGHRSR